MNRLSYAALGLCLLSFSLFLEVGQAGGETPLVGSQISLPWQQELRAKLTRLDAALVGAPTDLAALSERGDTHLFLGQAAEAVADFEKTIALDPAQDAPHWRLGIAYFFNGQWEKSSRQFAKYHAYDGHDRENGVWKFFADVSWHGLEKARADMLVYGQFDREPFPALYDLLAGKITEGQFSDGLKSRKLVGDRQVLFFADYYAGLYEEALGRHDPALQKVAAAVALFTPDQAASGGPGYMWRTARAHLEILRRAR
jgi:tetratricopeptide (TPR) repeat protein